MRTESEEKGHFLLIASRSEDMEGITIPGYEMARRRLEAKQWGLYENTPHKWKIKPGDQLIIYLAGPQDMKFFAMAVADKVIKDVADYDADGDALSDFPVAVLFLKDINYFPRQPTIQEVKDELDFIPKTTNKWGCVLQRGLKVISKKDSETILSFCGAV